MFTKEEKLKVLKPWFDTPIIVEGKRDVKKLKDLGFRKVIPLNGCSLYEISLDISKSYEEVVILTDFDKAGNELASRLNLFLEKLGVKINKRIRKETKEVFTRQGISEIEALKV